MKGNTLLLIAKMPSRTSNMWEVRSFPEWTDNWGHSWAEVQIFRNKSVQLKQPFTNPFKWIWDATSSQCDEPKVWGDTWGPSVDQPRLGQCEGSKLGHSDDRYVHPVSHGTYKGECLTYFGQSASRQRYGVPLRSSLVQRCVIIYESPRHCRTRTSGSVLVGDVCHW